MSEVGTATRPRPRPWWRSRRAVYLWAACGIVSLLLIVFGDVLVGGGLDIPSHAQGDTARWYVFMRLFGYAELRAGNLPLWNPHTFSGMPFVGTFQSAIYYPPNLLHLVTDLRLGLVLEFFLSLLVLGFLTFAWLRAKGIHALACFVGAVTVMFGSTVTLRVLAGQLSVLETFAWWPLLLLAVDALERRFSLGWMLAGILAVTLMILAGHPPTVLQAAVATAAYALPSLWRSPRRLAWATSLLPVAGVPPLLAAVQLFEGLGTASEALRRHGMSYDFAVSHSFPPEQLLTLLGPDLFGNADRFNLTYFGRVFYWDATYFFGVAGLLLALHGLRGRRREQRLRAGLLTALFAVVAMGGYTPLYRILYWLPGFDYIRAPSKFLFFSSVFLAWLVALGAERMLASREDLGRTAAIAAGLSMLAATLAAWTWTAPVSLTEGGGPMAWLTSLTRNPDFVVEGVAADWYERLWRGAGLASATAALAAALLWAGARRRAPVLAFLGLAVIELLVFARVGRGTTRMTIELDLRPQVVDAYAIAGSTRVHETAAPSNVAVARRHYAIWGYDPVILRRYIEFMTWTQGKDWRHIRKPTLFVPYHHHPLHAMLRVRYQIDWKTRERIEYDDAMPRFVFVDAFRVAETDSVLDAMGDPGFDPRRSVVLEQAPEPAPVPGTLAEAHPRLWVLEESTDHVDLEIDLARPLILVVTDAYSEGWRARPLHDSDQARYTVMPGNYVLRAIPLEAGHHRLRLEYAPAAHRAGVWVSGIVGVLYGATVVVWGIRRRSARPSPRP